MTTNPNHAEHRLQLHFNWREWATLTLMGTLAALSLLPAVWTQYQQIAQTHSVTVLAPVLNQILQTVVVHTGALLQRYDGAFPAAMAGRIRLGEHYGYEV